MSRDTELYWLHGWWPYNPDDLATRKGGIAIYDKMRHDDTIKACLNFKKYAVLSSGWYIEPAEGAEEDDPVAQFVEWNLRNMEGCLDEDLLEIMTAFDYGMSVTEKVFRILDDKTPYDGKVGLRALKTRKPHGVDFDWDEYGNLKDDGVIQGKHMRLPKSKFILYSHNKTFDNVYGESDLRACYRSWWSKDCIIRFWNIWLERYGAPPAVGKVTDFITPGDKTALENIIKNLTVKTGILLPKGVDLEFPAISGQGALAYREAVKSHDMAIARALLVPNLLGLSQQGDTGSYSQSQTHLNVFMWIVEKLRREHEELLYEHLIKELVDYNYKVEAYPRFRYLPLDEEKKVKMADLFLKAVEKGVISSELSDENQLRRTLGWEEREENEADIAKKKQIAMGGVNNGDKEGQKDEGKGQRQKEEVEKKSAGKEYAQQQIDFVRIEKDLDALEAEAKTNLVEVLQQQKAAAVDFLGKKIVKGELTTKLVNDLTLKYQRELQTIIREFLRATFDMGKQDAKKEIGKYNYAVKKIPPAAALAWFDKKSFWIKNIMNDALLKKIKTLLMNAMETGEPLKETIAKVEAAYEPYVGDPQVIRDDKQVEPYRIETLVRTNGTAAYSWGRINMFTDPDLDGYVVAVRLDAIFDTRTTEICKSLHGKIIRLDDPDFQRFVPPFHMNCRTIPTPWTTDDGAFEPIKRSEIDTALRLMPEDFGGRLGNK